jgi:predicted small lipoprotein YifL
MHGSSDYQQKGQPMHRYALLLLIAVFIAGCGQKGPLVLPNRTKPEQPHAPSTSPAPAPDAPPVNSAATP